MASQTRTIDANTYSPRRLSAVMRGERTVVVGAGVAGLSAAITLASRGRPVVLFETAENPGGKMRQVEVAGQLIDAGPTVLTMRWVFERMFEEAGLQLDTFVTTRPMEVLCRHFWQDGSQLDLFADRKRSYDAIAAFAGAAEANRYRAFASQAERLYRALEPTFIDATQPNAVSLAMRMSRVDVGSLTLLNPTASLWQTLCRRFTDPRLRQLFARYATYSGASPYEAASTLMLIAHAEQAGVWTVEGGMYELARAMARLATSLGVEIHTGCKVQSLLESGGKISGVKLANGDEIAANAVVLNADAAALSAGLFGDAFKNSLASEVRPGRSLSALATAIVGRARGRPLVRHNVFFSTDYKSEFTDIFRAGKLPHEPTVYLCAQDRRGTARTLPPSDSDERALVLVNAPADGDRRNYSEAEIEECWERTQAVLRRCNLELDVEAANRRTETPNTFHKLFPATGGALYGRSSHGWDAAFQRPGNRTLIPGLYLAGGSVHPGAGVPMAALSGRQAAASLLADLASTRRSHQVATSGGILMRSATTGTTD